MSHVVIGTCPACGHDLKTKAHAPRKQMHITCHCGWHGQVKVDETLVANAEALREHGVGHRRPKSAWEQFLKRVSRWWSGTKSPR